MHMKGRSGIKHTVIFGNLMRHRGYVDVLRNENEAKCCLPYIRTRQLIVEKRLALIPTQCRSRP